MIIYQAHSLLMVNRWHMSDSHALRNSGDTNAAHTGRMATMASLHHQKPTAALYEAILHHDAPEKYLGDPGHNVKVGTYGTAYTEAETAIIAEHGFFTAITEHDARWLKFLDRLDAYLFTKAVDPSQLELPEWFTCRTWLGNEAQKLGVSL